MRKALSMLFGMALLLALVVGLQAADDKEVTLKGTITCAKCDLKEAKVCTNVIKVKEGGKDVVYWFTDKGGKEKYHKEICRASKAGSVTGVIGPDKDGHKTITPKKEGGVKFK